jgi:hypothetical protein
MHNAFASFFTADPNEMRGAAQDNFGVLMEFVRLTYHQTYGRWWRRRRPAPDSASLEAS